jgi:putative endonuclease
MRTPDLTIVFVEVKARRNARYGSPQEAVTPGKQQNLRRAASDWLLDRRNRVQHAGIRFDVIAITMQEDHPVVHHIANAF